MKKIDRLKLEMICVYGENCWMNENYIPRDKNILTFHHILAKRYGGKRIWDNGALLSEKEHRYLNYLDNNYNRIYRELNGLFTELNRTYAPPTEAYYDEVKLTLRRR